MKRQPSGTRTIGPVAQLPTRFGASAVEQHELVAHVNITPLPVHAAELHSVVHTAGAGAQENPSAAGSQRAQSPTQAAATGLQVPVSQELQVPAQAESQQTASTQCPLAQSAAVSQACAW